MSAGIVDVRAIAALFPSNSRVDERHEPVVRGTLERELLGSRRPTLLRGLAKPWTAYERWTFPFLAAVGRGKEVVVTRSIVETEPTRRETLDLGSYLESILAADARVTGGPDQTYASLCPLFDLLPELRADIPFRQVFGPLTLRTTSAWIGPAGTITGLHLDTAPNMLAQIRGRKSLILFPPDVLAPYRSAKFDFISGLSRIDLAAPDFDRFPGLRDATPLLAHLDEGDGLFIPPNWWHYVVAETPSLSLSSFTGFVRHLVKGVVPMLPKLLLHHAGLYEPGNCTCHNPA